MTKKSLMIASAIILPLTVGVMAMGIGTGNKFNDHLVVGSNAINGTITFSASSSVLENGDLITAGKTNTGGDIYCKTTNNASSGGTNVVAAFKSGTVIRFYEDAECELQPYGRHGLPALLRLQLRQNQLPQVHILRWQVGYSSCLQQEIHCVRGGKEGQQVGYRVESVRSYYASS